MANEIMKTLNTRIKLRIDTLENWNNSTLTLLPGEIAFASVAASAGNGLEEPVIMAKIATEEGKTFKELPWAFHAKSSDVLTACKTEAGLTKFVQDVLAGEGIASDEVVSALAGRVSTAEGKIATLESDLNTAETGLKAKMAAAEKAIEDIEKKFGADNVAAEINAAIIALGLDSKYEVKGEAAKVQTALNEYKTSNDAAVQANANAADANAKAIAAIKDGTTIDSFADVETALAGKETAGAAAQALIDAKAYADGLAGNYDAKGAAATAESNAKAYAKEYADGLAKNYDAAGSAAQALTDAKAYTDSFTGGKTVSAYVGEVIANYSTTAQMNTAIATAKGEAVSHANGLNTAMDARVQVVEGKAHEHSFVESELNLIKSGDVAKWNAAEQNAKDYADDLDEAMDGRVTALEAKFTGNDSVAKQISDAVAAEAALREAADAGLQAQIGEASAEGKDATGLHARIEELEGLVGDDKVSEAIADAVEAEANRAKGVEGGLETRLKAVEDDYLKAADKEALQTQINTIMSNPDAEGAINSINEFTQYINEHKPIAEAFRTDINKNAADIDAEIKRAGEAEAELQGAINGVAADVEELQGEVDLKAAQADLTALAGRVTTVEGDLNAETTGLKAKMAAAEAAIDALEDLVGDDKVSEAIDAAIEALKIGDYAKAADLTAAINQHNTDKTALEGEIAKKANDADLAAIAKTGSTDDLVQGSMTLVFNCGGAN